MMLHRVEDGQVEPSGGGKIPHFFNSGRIRVRAARKKPQSGIVHPGFGLARPAIVGNQLA